MRSLRGRLRMKRADKGHPPTHSNPHHLSPPPPLLLSPVFQRYMLTERVNVLITEGSIPACQDVGVGHRGQM